MQNILVVEDDPDIRYILTTRLESRFNVISAPDAVVALAKVMETRPDLITLDIMMPGVFGVDKYGASLCDTLKNDPEYKKIPIIIISAVPKNSNPEIEAMIKKAEAHFGKPFDSKEVMERIDRILNK